MRLKYYLLYLLLILGVNFLSAQNYVPFAPRYNNNSLRGDMLLIGNNILSAHRSNNYTNSSGNNGTTNMVYVDIDGDGTTFSSSSANLVYPTAPSGGKCYRIAYAGLYWAGILQTRSSDPPRTNINKVKLKLPGRTNYEPEIIGQLIYDANVSGGIGIDNSKSYACYADVTTLISGLANPEGTYTVADVIASQGDVGDVGVSAGWTLFVVYETPDPTVTVKKFTSFDGFTGINGTTSLNGKHIGF